MIEFYDLNNEQLTAFSAAIESSEQKTFFVRIDCVTGYFLSCETVVEITIEARRNGTGSWTNISTSPINLSTWNGTRQNFEIRLTAAVVNSILRRQIKLKVSR